MLKDIETADKEDEDKIGKMSDEERKEWMSYDELMKKYNELEKETKPMWKSENPTKNTLQRFILRQTVRI